MRSAQHTTMHAYANVHINSRWSRRDGSYLCRTMATGVHNGNSRVAILGSGVMGLTTALQLKTKYPRLAVDVYTDRPINKTTSFGSGGVMLGDPTV